MHAMPKAQITCAVGVLLLFGGTALAESQDEYPGWMQKIGAAVASLRANVEAKHLEAAAGDAKELEAIFQRVAEFWQKRDAADAVRFAKRAHMSAAAIAKAAAQNDTARIASELDDLRATCGSCHNVHRQKLASGAFRVF